ncbi:MAG: hypothetical protein IIZ99_00170 [Turicibacter sp.]|nr:hypothetical protein [Turicibacter sp.]
MSYIVKNCPDFVLMRTATSGTYFNICGTAKGHVECKDCTDCVMKQIVELCEQYKKDFSTTNGVWLLANKITNLLDIQEVE